MENKNVMNEMVRLAVGLAVIGAVGMLVLSGLFPDSGVLHIEQSNNAIIQMAIIRYILCGA